ncbi:calcineurin-like phosphoesterase family protein [Parabacteroides sp. Marseille-P3160]|uniref:calcineurin-like phosphoesterase C-terminal domain-containing protein n=1 Tax=Parabacteroides sp. Marseille-P3160 TaxID=1917887 RepID=UPI0009BB2A50|nr:calcineurin-like phosphoesterase family protein [Parabacteroides sp. Marseille-P3160]
MKLKLFILLLVISSNLIGQNLVKGYVYEDQNQNGKKERQEKGVPNVAVSNGVNVTLTDASGAYELPVGNDNIIFVIKPSGYKIALDEFNLPKSYYIHKPAGSPSSFYKGVSPTGDLPKSVDFAIIKYDEPENFTSFIFGDSQTYTNQEIDYFIRGIVDEVKDIPNISFGITMGDLVGDNLTLHAPYKDAIKQIGLPWYNVLGNHDMNYDAKSDFQSDESFEASFGPNNYAFNYGKVHFIVLDDVLYPNPFSGKGYTGGLRDDQLEFVKNDLAHVSPDQLIVISMHIPLFTFKEAFREDDRNQLYYLLSKFPDVLVFSAHTHVQCHGFAGKEEGLNREKPIHEYNVGTTCGDWYSGILDDKGLPVSTMRDGTPKGYAFLNIKGNKYTLDYKVAGKPADYQISIYNPKVVPSKKGVSSGIYANFFMGSENDLVECRVDDGEWRKMKRVEDYDPAYYRYVQDWDFIEELRPVRRPSNPEKSRHLWRANIPTNLSVGEHQIEVRGTDLFGRVYTAKSKYKIQEFN